MGTVLVLSGIKVTDVPGADGIAVAGLVFITLAVAGSGAIERLLVRRARPIEAAVVDRS
jgi:hypothetical protein